MGFTINMLMEISTVTAIIWCVSFKLESWIFQVPTWKFQLKHPWSWIFYSESWVNLTNLNFKIQDWCLYQQWQRCSIILFISSSILFIYHGQIFGLHTDLHTESAWTNMLLGRWQKLHFTRSRTKNSEGKISALLPGWNLITDAFNMTSPPYVVTVHPEGNMNV